MNDDIPVGTCACGRPLPGFSNTGFYKDRATLPHPDTLPIPENVQVDETWSPLMIEIADHVGAYTTLLIIDHFGGTFIHIPVEPALNPLREVIGDKAADIITQVFGRERLNLPVGRSALARARRAGVLARVRAGDINLTEAARILRTSRRYMSDLINRTKEGVGADIVPSGPGRSALVKRVPGRQSARLRKRDEIVGRIHADELSLEEGAKIVGMTKTALAYHMKKRSEVS